MSKARLSRGEAIKAWWTTQGFDERREKTPRAVLHRRTWPRALAGADPYFALLARGQGMTVEKVATALRKGDIRVSPAVRGCMYVVARAEADLALSLAYHHGHKRIQRDIDKAGGTLEQTGRTTKAVLSALSPRSSFPTTARRAFSTSWSGPAWEKAPLEALSRA